MGLSLMCSRHHNHIKSKSGRSDGGSGLLCMGIRVKWIPSLFLRAVPHGTQREIMFAKRLFFQSCWEEKKHLVLQNNATVLQQTKKCIHRTHLSFPKDREKNLYSCPWDFLHRGKASPPSTDWYCWPSHAKRRVGVGGGSRR